MDYEKFYSECVPKSHLPSDFGGDLESVEVLHNKHRESLMELRDYFMMEEQQANLSYEEYVEEFCDDAKKWNSLNFRQMKNQLKNTSEVKRIKLNFDLSYQNFQNFSNKIVNIKTDKQIKIKVVYLKIKLFILQHF